MKSLDLKLPMALPDLITALDETEMLANRDKTDLLALGIDQPMLDELHDVTAELKNLPTDGEMVAQVTAATARLNTAADALVSSMQSLNVKAKRALGDSSPEYKCFGFSAPTRQTIPELLQMARRMKRSAASFTEVLATKGYTPEMLVQFDQAMTDVEAKVDLQHTAKHDRDVQTVKRGKVAIKAYALLRDIREEAKLHFAKTDQARYNDYVLYGGHGGKKIEELLPGIITGTVLSAADSQPVTNATVLFVETDKQEYTDDDGVFYTDDNRPGTTYTLQIAAPGFVTATFTTPLLHPGGEITDTYLLQPEAATV